jgi:hypothetical protein
MGPLLEEIHGATGVPVMQWDPVRELAVKSRRLQSALAAQPDLGPLLAVCLGLALRRN